MKKISPHFLSLPLSARRLIRGTATAFTLVELLVVMSVVAVILSMSGPAVTALTGAGEVSSSVYDIAGLLGQARSYATANNTYVYVGFNESDAAKPETGRQVDGKGRVSVAVIAAKDGARGYDINNAQASWASYAAGTNLLLIGKVRRFNNLHLVDLGDRPTSGGMVRPPLQNTDAIAPESNLGNDNCTAATVFEYPLGKESGKGDYTFTKVIQFDPQGVARIQRADNGDTIAKRIEIGLQQAHGAMIPALPKAPVSGPIAAIQIDCMTGSTRIFRP